MRMFVQLCTALKVLLFMLVCTLCSLAFAFIFPRFDDFDQLFYSSPHTNIRPFRTQHGHDRMTLHRDLKTANVCLMHDNTDKLATLALPRCTTRPLSLLHYDRVCCHSPFHAVIACVLIDLFNMDHVFWLVSVRFIVLSDYP